MTDFANFLNSKQVLDFRDPNIFHDRVLVVGENKFYVVSGVLSLWSEYFCELFNENSTENNKHEIELKEIDTDKLELFLQLLHQNPSELRKNNLISMIDLSYFFKAQRVLATCLKCIDEHFDSCYWIREDLLDRACTYNILDLKDKVMDYLYQEESLRSVNVCKLLDVIAKHELYELKSYLLMNLEELTTYFNCPALLDYSMKFGMPELKTKIVDGIAKWKIYDETMESENDSSEDMYWFIRAPNNIGIGCIIKLVESAFKHDIQILKDKVSKLIFYGCSASNRRNSDKNTITVNQYLLNFHEEIFKQPAEIMQFIVMSTVTIPERNI